MINFAPIANFFFLSFIFCRWRDTRALPRPSPFVYICFIFFPSLVRTWLSDILDIEVAVVPYYWFRCGKLPSLTHTQTHTHTFARIHANHTSDASELPMRLNPFSEAGKARRGRHLPLVRRLWGWVGGGRRRWRLFHGGNNTEIEKDGGGGCGWVLQIKKTISDI